MAPLPHTRRPATLASLAAELGVSRTTVSNAYNRPDQLSAPLRARVLETAKRVGYPGPDPVARSLRTRRAGAVGLLLTEELSYAFRDPAAVGFLEGLAQACQEGGQGLLLVPVSPQRTDVAPVHRAGVDGFVVYSVREDDPHYLAVLQRPVPIVVCDQPVTEAQLDWVCIDDRAAMLGLARHVAGLGHRRVGVICMRLGSARNDGLASVRRQEQASYLVQRNRLAGLRDGCVEAGIDWSGVPVVEQFEHTSAAGATAARMLLEAYPDLTALLCTSDILAVGALRCAAQRGMDAPADITVTGFDGLAEAQRVGLTTIRQPVRQKGVMAGRLLLESEHRTIPRHVTLPTELIVGATSGPPRA